MSEQQAPFGEQAFLQTIQEISELCIDPAAQIGQGVEGTVWCTPNGRYMKIGQAEIANGVTIDKCVHIEDGVTVGQDAQVGFSSTLSEGSNIGEGVQIGVAVHIGKLVEIAPHVSIGHVSRISDGATLGPNARIAPQAFIGRGLYVDEAVAPHQSIRTAADDSKYPDQISTPSL